MRRLHAEQRCYLFSPQFLFVEERESNMDRTSNVAGVFLVSVGAFALIFGATYADAYLLHRGDITPNRIWHDIAFAIVLTVGFLWSFRGRFRANRPLL